MRIIWVTNIIFPYPSEKLGIEKTVLGGWMLSLLEEIKKQKKINEIAIVSIYHGSKYLRFSDKNVIYYMIPCKNKEKYDKKVSLLFKDVYKDFNPDLIHIHGTEYPHSFSAIENSGNIKTIVSIQGLVSVCGIKNNYNAGISKYDLLKSITLRDLIRNDLLFNQALKFRKKGKYEEKVLQKCNYIIGRTSWDKAYAYNVSLQNKYKRCNENLRETFYNNSWDITKIERHTIFISQASYPIKGFHILLKSAKLLKRDYPDLKIYVAGTDIIKITPKSFFDKIKLTGYGKYLLKLIKKYNLGNNVKFVGILNEKEMVQYLLKSHVFVQASSIENSPNSLGEAMLLGMPCIASYVGGTADILLDKREGYLYPFGDYIMLTYYISEIFKNDSLSIEYGQNAKKHAMNTHDKKVNCSNLINIYLEVLNEDKK